MYFTIVNEQILHLIQLTPPTATDNFMNCVKICVNDVVMTEDLHIRMNICLLLSIVMLAAKHTNVHETPDEFSMIKYNNLFIKN